MDVSVNQWVVEILYDIVEKQEQILTWKYGGRTGKTFTGRSEEEDDRIL
jgi:hypothetical protein